MIIEHYIFLFALIAIFLIPGTTNAIIANIAYQKGSWVAIKRLPAEYLGYLYAIGLWSIFIHIMSPYWIIFNDILHFFSIIYIFWIAFHLWNTSDLQKHLHVSKRLSSKAVFYSTLTNPKAILLAVGIFPKSTWESVEYYAMMMFLLGLIMLPCALFWIFFGRTLRQHSFIINLKATQFYKGSALFLVACTIPMIIQFCLS